MSKDPITAVLVYLERRKTRKLVGRLTYDVKSRNYIFQYHEKYLSSKLIPLGPELPLRRKPHLSPVLFESFVDRIPSRENPAYRDYCLSTGIDVQELDPFVLLTTIARRGPSSFVFEAEYNRTFSVSDLKAFRSRLHLTIKEFALAFHVSQKTLVSIENGQRAGREVMRRLELYVRFPEIALFEFRRNCGKIHVEKVRLVEQIFSGKRD